MSCAACKKATSLKSCGACRKVSYCSIDCQKKHWSSHKPFCLETRTAEHNRKLLSYFHLTEKDLITRIIYEQIKVRIRPKTGPIPATINFILIFMIGESVDKISEQILKIYEIPVDTFVNCVRDDMVRQQKLELLQKPEKIPLVIVEYYQERKISEEQSEFLHGAGLTLYPFEDGPLANKLGLPAILPLQEQLNKAIDEQGKTWNNPVDFVLPLEMTNLTKHYLPLLDKLKLLPYESREIFEL